MSAIAQLREAAEIYRLLGDRARYAQCVSGMAMFEVERGETGRAKPLLEESVRINREIGDKQFIAFDLGALGTLLSEEGDFEAGLARYEESISVARESGNPERLMASLCNLAQLAIAAGRDQRAADALAEALRIVRDRGNVSESAYTSIYLGVLACRRGERAEGAELIRTGLATARDLGDRQYTADALRAAAGAICEEDPLAAARLWGAAEALYAQMGASERIDRAIYAAAIERGGLMAGDDEFRAAWRDGAGAPLDEMVAQAEQLLLRAAPTSTATP